jgi:PilZ domain
MAFDSGNVRRIRRPSHEPTSPGRRMRANWPAELRSPSVRVACRVLDISVGGAKLQLQGPLPRNVTKMWLVVEPFGPIYGEPVWHRRGAIGLRFLEDHPEIARLQMRRFSATAWLDATDPTLAPAKD